MWDDDEFVISEDAAVESAFEGQPYEDDELNLLDLEDA